MPSQPGPGVFLLPARGSVNGEPGSVLKSVDPIQEAKRGPMTILAAQERPGFSNNEIRGQNLFGTSQVGEHRHGVGVTCGMAIVAGADQSSCASWSDATTAARTPLTKRPERPVENRFASSTASSRTTPTGVSV